MSPLLALEHVGRSYWRGDRQTEILTDVTLDLARREVAALCGRSRAGKTTLLQVACGLLSPTSGRVLVGGRDVSQLTRRQRSDLLREQIAYIPMRHGPESTSCTVRRWITSALLDRASRREGDRIAGQALKLVGVGDLLDADWISLSDTERSLVAIARGIAKRPRVLLIDDATIGLDLLERADLLALLHDLVDRFDLGVLLSATAESDVPGLGAYWSLGAGTVVGSRDHAPANVIPMNRDVRRPA